VYVKLCVGGVKCQRLVVVPYGPIVVFKRVLALRQPIWDPSVSDFVLVVFAAPEVLDGVVESLGLELADASSVVGLRTLCVYLYGLREVLYCILVVTHVLEHNASSNEDRLVVWDLLQDLTEALQSILVPRCLVVHQPKMEPAADEVLLHLQGLVEHLDGSLHQLLVRLLSLLVDLVGLALEGEALGVPQLCVVRCDVDGPVVVLVSCPEHLWFPVQVDVTPIEYDRWIVRVDADGSVEVLLGSLKVL
jgi:hypothetical protein